jgi:hypothetical protein
VSKLLLAVLFFGFLAFIGCAGWTFRLAVESTMPHTRGVVNDIEFETKVYERRNGTTDTYKDLIATYRYKVGEQQYQSAENFGSHSQHPPKVGEAVELRYDPNHPEQASIATDNSLKLVLIVGVASLICLAASVAAGFLLLRRR